MKNDYEIRGDVTAIFIKYKGRIMETLIDTTDLKKADSFKGTWGADYYSNQDLFYVAGKIGNKSVYLHRLLMGNPEGELVDHIFGTTLDNRKSVNLRVTNKSGNAQNQRNLRSDNKSGVRGVCWSQRDKRWVAKFRVEGKIYNIGYFKNIIKAEQAIKLARSKYMPFSPEAENRRAQS